MTRKVIPFPKKFSAKFPSEEVEAALRDAAKATDAPVYLVHIDESNGYVNVSSALTHKLTFQRKKEIAKAVSAAIKAI